MLDEIGLEYQHVGAVRPTKLPEGISNEELATVSPSGKVSVLVEGDWGMTESFAINLYLCCGLVVLPRRVEVGYGHVVRHP